MNYSKAVYKEAKFQETFWLENSRLKMFENYKLQIAIYRQE